MSTAKRVDLHAFRNDPMPHTLAIRGFDLTGGAAMKFAVRSYRGQAGAALISLAETETPGADGIRVVDVITDDDGVPTSLVEIIQSKTVMAALPPAVEAGAVLNSHGIFQWTLPDDGSSLSSLEETKMLGDLYLEGSVND